MTPAVPGIGPGYSGTPLAQKLGWRENRAVRLVGEPQGYRDWLGAGAATLTFVTDADAGLAPPYDAHVFVVERAELAQALTRLRHALPPDGMLWVSWPKKASKVPTDITEDVIRELCLPLGWVDVKVCAVSDVWSGLKLVVRKELR